MNTLRFAFERNIFEKEKNSIVRFEPFDLFIFGIGLLPFMDCIEMAAVLARTEPVAVVKPWISSMHALHTLHRIRPKVVSNFHIF